MNKLFIASNNKDKIKEIKEILKERNINCEVFCPKDFNDNDSPIEDGLTFAENALIKAQYYYDKYHMPTIADDSGLCIDYLNNLPGIHSSRFMESYSYEDRNNFIIELMKNINDRRCRFVADIAYIDKDITKVYEGIVEGEIAYKQAGNNGFGYDPLFYVKEFDKTLAEVDESIKNQISHRSRALRKWADENF